MINKYVLKELYDAWPSLETEMIECYWRPGAELIIKLRDGNVVAYRFGGFRKLPSDPKEMTYDQITKEFGIRLRNIMEVKAVDQCELSNRTGIAQPTLSNYINGKNCPSFAVVDKIARALNCSMDDFRL